MKNILLQERRCCKQKNARQPQPFRISDSAVQGYCAGVMALANELEASNNPTVIRDGLAILKLHPKNVRWLFKGKG